MPPKKRARTAGPGSDALSASEATQYDRQIRLWGLDAQKRIRGTRVLMVNMGGLAAETAKNLVLAGVQQCVVLDVATVSVDDLTAQFFLSAEDVGANRGAASIARLSALNPMVEVSHDGRDAASLTPDDLRVFDVVCATKLSLSQLARLNGLCREAGARFFCGDVLGQFGFHFADLGVHTYIAETRTRARKEGEEDEIKQVEMTETYSPLAVGLAASLEGLRKRELMARRLYCALHALDRCHAALGHYPSDSSCPQLGEARAQTLAALKIPEEALPADYLATVARNCACELSPVAAILGGLLAGEIIKTVSGKEKPHNSLFLYDGVGTTGTVHCLAALPEPAAAPPPDANAIVL